MIKEKIKIKYNFAQDAKKNIESDQANNRNYHLNHNRNLCLSLFKELRTAPG
jgi:hypothetical protein